MSKTLFGDPILRLFLGAALISLAPIFVKSIENVGPTWIGVYRCGIAALLLLPTLLFNRSTATKDGIFKQDKAVWGFLVLAGLCFACDLFLWHRSLIYVGAGLGTLLANTQVFYLAIIGVTFAGETCNRWLVGSIGLGFFGLVVAFGEAPNWAHEQHYLRGVVFGLLTGITYSIYIMSMRQAEKRTASLPSVQKLALVTSFSSIFLICFALIGEPLVVPNFRDAVFLILLAVIPQIIGWLLIISSLPQVPMSRAGLILLVQPCGALIMGAMIFEEVLTLTQVIGVVVALTGIYLGNVRKVRAVAG